MRKQIPAQLLLIDDALAKNCGQFLFRIEIDSVEKIRTKLLMSLFISRNIYKLNIERRKYLK